MTFSSTFPIRLQTPLISCLLMASISPSISGCLSTPFISRLSYTSFVDTLIGGFAIRIQQRGSGGRAVSFSPIPSANAVPLITQYGTSAPMETPSSIRSFVDKPRSNSLFIPNRVDAASVLPPARPADTGMNLLRSISTPPANPHLSFKSFAALYIRLFSLTGRKKRLDLILISSSGILVIISLSYMPMVCITIRTS